MRVKPDALLLCCVVLLFIAANLTLGITMLVVILIGLGFYKRTLD